MNMRRHTASLILEVEAFGTSHQCLLVTSSYNRRVLSSSYSSTHQQQYAVLSVPTAGMEDLVAGIGSSTGAKVNKWQSLRVAACAPGWQDLDASLVPFTHPASAVPTTASEHVDITVQQPIPRDRRTVPSYAAPLIAVRDCVAHVVCRVVSRTEDEGHYILRCQVTFMLFRGIPRLNSRFFCRWRSGGCGMSTGGAASALLHLHTGRRT